MEKEKLRRIMLDQKEAFLLRKNLIDRDIDLIPFLKTKQIVLISGIRRCGKSSLLYLIHKKVHYEFLYFNFDDERLSEFKVEDFNNLYEIFLEQNPKNFVFYFDEIQVIEGWERFLNRMYEQGIKIFVTGSNAKLLSSEIGTALTGRNIVLKLFPFSFKEFLRFNEIENTFVTTKSKSKIVNAFNIYFKSGGFPLVVKEQNPDILKMYYNDILFRDIVARYNLQNVDELKILATYLLSNCGRILSYSNLGAMSGISSKSLVKKYLYYFFESFMFYEISKFDFSIKKQILNPRKIYTSDIGFIKEAGFNFSDNNGNILENLILIFLKQKDKEVYYHKEKYECDFVIKKGLKIVEAIQSCYYLNESNKKREINGLLDALDSYNLEKGLILTYDQEDSFVIKGKKIKVLPLWKWLLLD